MANFLSKIKINTATDKFSKMDLSCDHVTSQDFFKVRPVYYRELVPKQSIDIRHSCFVRLAPLAKPMYGNVRMVNRAFFVPMRTIFPAWNDFITDATSIIDGNVVKVDSVPQVANSTFAGILAGTIAGATAAGCSTIVTSGTADFETVDSDDLTTFTQYRYTDKGRRVVTILQSLGYNINYGNVYSYLQEGDTYVSLLPLLAFAKVKADWFTLGGYPAVANTLYAAIDHFKSGGIFGSETADNTAIINIFDALADSSYDQDYFTSAWDCPTQPNAAVSSTTASFRDITNDRTGTSGNYDAIVQSKSSATTGAPSTPAIVSGAGGSFSSYSVTNLTQYAVDALKSLTDYVKRHQLVGGKALDRMLARFGVTLESEKLNRSVYLGSSTLNIQVSDVMATSDTTGAALGDYAGKGIGFDQNGHFSYKTDEYGYLIIISTILPKIGYVQGLNKNNQHISRLDFYTPEFDGLGVQAVSCSEVYNDQHTNDQLSGAYDAAWDADGVWGYLPRYAEYKASQDFLSGDFRFDSKNANLDSYHLFRIFDPIAQQDYDEGGLISHNTEFCTGDQIPYDRVFNTQTDNGNAIDHFYSIHHFDVNTTAPMSSLFDNYEFEDKGKEVTETINGTQLN